MLREIFKSKYIAFIFLLFFSINCSNKINIPSLGLWLKSFKHKNYNKIHLIKKMNFGHECFQNHNHQAYRINNDELKYICLIYNLEYLDVSECSLNDQNFHLLKKLKNLKYLNIASNNITDYGFKQIAAISSLEDLIISYNKITDQGIKYLVNHRNLKSIMITGSLPKDYNDVFVGDKGIEYLSKIVSLEKIDLSMNYKITDKSVKYLIEMKHLKELRIRDTNISKESFKLLKKKLHNTKIIY